MRGPKSEKFHSLLLKLSPSRYHSSSNSQGGNIISKLSPSPETVNMGYYGVKEETKRGKKVPKEKTVILAHISKIIYPEKKASQAQNFRGEEVWE